MIRSAIIAGLVLPFSLGTVSRAQVQWFKVGDTLVDSEALTIQGAFGQAINGKSFQQDIIVSYLGWQYLAYYDKHRHVCVARRPLAEGCWEIARFLDYDFRSNDAHNTISLGICPADGTIHLAFDHHGHPLHYRVSQPHVASQPKQTHWKTDLFGPVRNALEDNRPIRITYPRFWQTPAGTLQFCYRRGGSGNGDRMMVDYDPNTGSWLQTRQIDSGKGNWDASTSRCSYPNGYTYGSNGRLHATWVWREGAQTANHDLMYAYSDDCGVTWCNNAGQVLGEPAHVNSPGITVAKIPIGYGLMNTHGQAIDTQGRVHVVLRHCSDKSLQAAGSRPGERRWGPAEAWRYQHYWRDEVGDWHHIELPWVAGNRPKVFVDRRNNVHLVFARNDQLNLATATAASQWTDWEIGYLEPGALVNEMLGDFYRWQHEQTLSIVVQQLPAQPHQPTALRVLDFRPPVPE